MQSRIRPFVLVAALGTTLVGCQSFEKGMEELCEAPSRCSTCANPDPAMRQMSIAEHIGKSVSNGEVKELLKAVAMADPSTKAELLETEARRAGLASCALADDVRQSHAEEAAGGGPPDEGEPAEVAVVPDAAPAEAAVVPEDAPAPSEE